MGFRNVVFVADQLYELKKDKIQGRPVPALTRAVDVPDLPRQPARVGQEDPGTEGQKDGCTDCHADNAPFFTKLKVRSVGKFLKDSYPTPKEPIAEPQMVDWGLTGVPASE